MATTQTETAFPVSRKVPHSQSISLIPGEGASVLTYFWLLVSWVCPWTSKEWDRVACPLCVWPQLSITAGVCSLSVNVSRSLSFFFFFGLICSILCYECSTIYLPILRLRKVACFLFLAIAHTATLIIACTSRVSHLAQTVWCRKQQAGRIRTWVRITWLVSFYTTFVEFRDEWECECVSVNGVSYINLGFVTQSKEISTLN